MMFGVTLPFETLSRQLLSSIGFQTLLLTEKGVEKKLDQTHAVHQHPKDKTPGSLPTPPRGNVLAIACVPDLERSRTLVGRFERRLVHSCSVVSMQGVAYICIHHTSDHAGHGHWCSAD